MSINGLYVLVVASGLVVVVEEVDELVAVVGVVMRNVFPFVSIPVEGGKAVEIMVVLNKPAGVD